MKSIAELKEIRERALEEMSMRNTDNSRKIVIGMATCGIAAGARPVMKAFTEELKLRKISDVPVLMTGCIGVCRLEPMVDVIDKDGSKVTYVSMTPEKARQIVAEHIVNGNVCTEYTISASQADVKE